MYIGVYICSSPIVATLRATVGSIVCKIYKNLCAYWCHICSSPIADFVGRATVGSMKTNYRKH